MNYIIKIFFLFKFKMPKVFLCNRNEVTYDSRTTISSFILNEILYLSQKSTSNNDFCQKNNSLNVTVYVIFE